jgi:hypothetical protein
VRLRVMRIVVLRVERIAYSLTRKENKRREKLRR